MAKVYHPIPGLGTGRGSLNLAVRSRIYQGPDHLLIVQSTGYTEEYRRIFYRDIRYVDIRKNSHMLWQAIISGTFLAFFLLLYFLQVPLVAVGVLSTPFLIWLVVNLLSGPTCDCYVSTSVQ